MKIGFTTVTFRNKTAEENLALAVRNGADGIEWGGDVHVPPTDPAYARDIAAKTAAAGLSVLSYGSYYRPDEDGTKGGGFAPVLETAKALGAPTVRIWAGSRSPHDADEAYIGKIVRTVRAACDMAKPEGIDVAFEYHRHSLTETADSAVSLMERIGRSNARCYWQPDPELPMEKNMAELIRIRPFLANVHVFFWNEKNEKLPLRFGEQIWRHYRDAVGSRPNVRYILEFCRDENESIFEDDMATMRRLFSA